MTGRPTEIPTWATNATYSAPTEAWDGVDPKLDPGSGLRATGHTPETQPNPRHFNYDQNLYGKWFTWLSEIQISNWNAPVQTTNCIPRCGTYLESDKVWLVGGATAIVFSYDGHVWEQAASVIGSLTIERCAGNLSGEAVFVGDTGGNIVKRRSGAGAWTEPSLPGGIDANAYDIAWDDTNSTFIAIGDRDTGSRTVRAYTSADGTTWAEVTVGADVASRTGRFCTVSPAGVFVAFADSAGRYWRTVDGGSNWTDYADPFSANIVLGLVWNNARSVFVVVLDSDEMYESADGITWTKVDDLESTPTQHTLCTDGDGTIAYADGGGSYTIKYTMSYGVRWAELHVTKFAGVTLADLDGLFWAGDRFFQGYENPGSAGDGILAASIRTGTRPTL